MSYLQDALDIAMKMALCMPLNDILSYRKVARSYFAMLDVLAHNHTAVLARTDIQTFAAILISLDSGLRNLEPAISSQCATAVDNLAAYYLKNNQAFGAETTSPAAQVDNISCLTLCPSKSRIQPLHGSLAM